MLISGGWNRGVPLYTEASSFQGVGIEEFHCIQRHLHFRGVGIERLNCIITLCGDIQIPDSYCDEQLVKLSGQKRHTYFLAVSITDHVAKDRI